MHEALESSLIELQPRGESEYISQSRTVMWTNREGWAVDDQHHGLWIFQSRALSRYRWLINGKPPEFSAFSPLAQNSSIGYYIAAPKNYKQTETQESDPAQQTIELRIRRQLGDGMHEHIYLSNHTQIRTVAELTLEVASDFKSPSDKDKSPGSVSTRWRKTTKGWELHFDFKAQHSYQHQGDRGVARIHRGIRVELNNKSPKPNYRGGKLRFRIPLAPHGSEEICLKWIAQIEGKDLPLFYGCDSPGSERERKQKEFLDCVTRFASPASPKFPALVLQMIERSRRDLAALRMFDLDSEDSLGEAWVPAAGLPIYVGLFGRDSLAASWEATLLSTAMVRGTLHQLPKTQGTRVDHWRDEQPGQIVHELHTDPRSVLNFTPHGRYYGGVTASIHYPVVLATLWHWSGDKQAVKPHIEAALKGLAWADKYSRDKQGFYRYQTFSDQGEKNQGWKDSDDAIVYANGKQVKDPLGTCEMQGFVYASKILFAELLWWMEEIETARRMWREAEELKKRFNDFFWMDDENYFGMAVDSKNRLVRSIASDPGHCLASGIVDTSLAPRMAKRLLQPDLFSGWGIRTLSSEHPAYNPFSYHRGSVWPVENAVFVLALARYGLHAEMQKLARALFETAEIFKYQRLPEVFAGHSRDEAHPFPGMYPRANWPQAWSASAVFTVMQALLGIYPYAPLNVLLIDPHLPEWLPEFSLERLRIGGAQVNLRFERQKDGSTSYEVTALKGKLHVIRQPSPWSLTAGFGERVKDAIVSLIK
ncbi:MAG TPA: glycogen debranching N-terminal domain-containing protein [Terriglobales bacterium]|nr:glycogen debranching N-terminal domain-containing protein [Terriglobales bacterium]